MKDSKLFKGVSKITEVRGNNEIYNLHTRATFQALVHTIVPAAPSPTVTLGTLQAAGALDLNVYEYIIWVLDRSLAIPIELQLNLVNISLSRSTAQLLDAAAARLIQTGQAKYLLNVWAFPGGGPFAALSRSDRLRAITLLERLEINFGSLPDPYQNNPGLVRNMMDVLNQLTMFGHYSEWTAYGATRLFPPDYRRMEYFPPGWIQSQYPGPAFGYRDFRGFLAIFPHKGGKA